MHRMSNLNKFKIFYQVLEKNLGLCSLKKKIKKCFKKFFWLEIFITNILCANVYKMYECDKNQMPYYKVFKKINQFFENFGPLIKHGPHWINYTIFIFINNNNLLINWPIKKIKFISFDKKKKTKCKTSHDKSEEKNKFESP
jgi:hypothetical protein